MFRHRQRGQEVLFVKTRMRQRETEGGAMPDAVDFHPNAVAMNFDDPLDQGQSNTGPVVFCSTCRKDRTSSREKKGRFQSRCPEGLNVSTTIRPDCRTRNRAIGTTQSSYVKQTRYGIVPHSSVLNNSPNNHVPSSSWMEMTY